MCEFLGRQWMDALWPTIPFWSQPNEQKEQTRREKQGTVTIPTVNQQVTRNRTNHKYLSHSITLKSQVQGTFLYQESVQHSGNNWVRLKNRVRTPAKRDEGWGWRAGRAEGRREWRARWEDRDLCAPPSRVPGQSLGSREEWLVSGEGLQRQGRAPYDLLGDPVGDTTCARQPKTIRNDQDSKEDARAVR